jgi:hypothetical protein
MSNTFTGVLMEYNNGALDELLVNELQDVVMAVRRTEKAGTLTLKIKVSPNGDAMVELDATVNTNKPAGSVGKALFFPTEEGLLLRRDPRQAELRFRDVAAEPAKVRTFERTT